MNRPIAIADNVHWVGVNDRDTDLFESLWPLPRGISYNSYLIADKKTALIDTVKDTYAADYVSHLRELVGEDAGIDYLVVNHLEPDHSGTIPALLDHFPDLTVVGNKKTARFLQELYGAGARVQTVEDGEQLELGTTTLQFHLTPMVHWPETMMTYDRNHRILFSGDAFGTFGALDGGLFDDEIDVDRYEDETRRYFANIVAKYAKMVQKALAKLSDLDIAVIAATHGPVWRDSPQTIVGMYDRLSRQETEPGVVVAYASMYRNTEGMMEAVVRQLAEKGVRAICVHDLARSHVSYVLRDVWRYRALIIGTPTYDTGVFPAVQSFINFLDIKKPAGRLLGLFGTCGWSGGGVKGLKAFAENSDFELIEPVAEACFRPGEKDLDAARQMAAAVAERTRP